MKSVKKLRGIISDHSSEDGEWSAYCSAIATPKYICLSRLPKRGPRELQDLKHGRRPDGIG